MNQLVDCLSRLGSQNDNIKLPKLHIYQITCQLKARSNSLNQLCIATQVNDELVLLKCTITNGWPNSIKEVPHEIQAYWTFCEELTIKDGLVLKVTEIVIPKSKCKQVLMMIHRGHLGLGKCKLWIKDTVYWLGINEQTRKTSSKTVNYAWNTPKQTSCKYVFRTKDSDIPKDKSCDWYISLWEWLISTYSQLHEQISCST